MNIQHRRAFILSLATAVVLATGAFAGKAVAAATAEELNQDGERALKALYSSNPTAQKLAKEAKAVLVFPNIVKAGLVFGGAYGEGVLTKGSKVSGYYNSISASWAGMASSSRPKADSAIPL